MIKATKNQLHNINNPSQGNTKKVLAVCSAGLLRSATLQNFLIKEYGYNVRNCGTEASYALIPISEALVKWADEILFVDRDVYYDVKKQLKEFEISAEIHIMNIPDIYNFNDPKLLNLIKYQYEHKCSELNKRLQEIIEDV